MAKQLENVDANIIDKHSTSSLSLEVQAVTSLNDIRALNSFKERGRACVVDPDGYIACGPIVGEPRPAERPTKPYFPEPSEIKPMWPDKGGKGGKGGKDDPGIILYKESLENK
jgi:hypothetical protein